MIEDGKKVKVHYTGTLDDGTQFDSSRGRDPIEFEMGAGTVIPGFEAGVREMEVGETRKIRIPAEEAYGPHREELVMEFERDRLPPDLEPEVGMTLEMRGPDGRAFPVRVIAVNEKTITLDANHPLAGKALNFELELVSVEE